MTDSKGRFGAHGGQYISETLMNAVDELEKAYNYYKEDEGFKRELDDLLKKYAGRPSLLYYAKNMTKDLGGAKVYLKREDLNHTGAHKINNVLGQCLLAKKMGKKRVIAETGAGQHGVATATVAALMGMECEIFMGEVDCKRQALNVYRMKLLGAKVHSVSTGTGTLKDAVSETMSEWTRRIDDTHYVLGSAMGPHPFPTIVRDFQAVISKEAREQILEVHARKKKLADDVDLKVIAKNTSGFAGADLENVLNEAALLAARRNYKEIGMKEIEDAMVKVTMGPEKKTRVRSEKENRLVAYHEAGHAVVSRYLPTQDPVHQISIIPRGMAGGYTMYRPTEDKSFMSKTEMEENIVSLLGGRVAEALILNDVSTGASNDIERATKIARSMVTKYGMSDDVGMICYDDDEEVFIGRDLGHTRGYSENVAARIDSEVKRILDECSNKARQMIRENEDVLYRCADLLLEKEKIGRSEFEALFEAKADDVVTVEGKEVETSAE